ncbi:MAG: hypothetical protein WBE76_29360 [Terracidiphilus sp.]
METFFVTVGPEGEIEIPGPIRQLLKMEEETRVSLHVDGPRIILTREAEVTESNISLE